MDKGCQRGESRISLVSLSLTLLLQLAGAPLPAQTPVNISLKFELKCWEKEDCKKRDQGVLKPHKNKLNWAQIYKDEFIAFIVSTLAHNTNNNE